MASVYPIKLFIIMQRTDPLLGTDCDTNNETTAIARQRAVRSNGSTVGGHVFYVVCSKAISCNQPSSVQLVQCREVKGWLVSQ
jgi:hypothetical protein